MESQTDTIDTPNDTAYPIALSIAFPQHQSRLLALFSLPLFLIRILFLIPHIIVLYIIQIIALIAAWLNLWVILFTGHSSKGLHSFMGGALRWSTRISAYAYGLTDKYPPFGLK